MSLASGLGYIALEKTTRERGQLKEARAINAKDRGC